jgi:hypothetical protein
MDLESAQRIATEQRNLNDSIRNYKPGKTGYEELSPPERFNLLWARLERLSKGGLYRHISVGGLGLVIKGRSGPDIRDTRPQNPFRLIEVAWILDQEVLVAESLKDTSMMFYGNEEASRKIGAVEESLATAESTVENAQAA